MKKQIALVLTLTVFFMTACDDEPIGPGTVSPPDREPAVIRSFYPTAGASGSTVAIFGENFGATSSDNYVTFDSVAAEITYVGYGILNVRVPDNLTDGDYTISLNAKGRVTSAPRTFKVTNSSN